MTQKIIVEVEHVAHRISDPEDWMRQQGWRMMTRPRQTDHDFAFVGTRSETVGSNVFGKEFFRYEFRDPKKARLFMLVWSGNRI